MLLAGSGAAVGAEKSILVFGDSLSAAYGMAQARGWVALLAERLKRERADYSVVNASISGETSAGGAARIGRALARAFVVRPKLLFADEPTGSLDAEAGAAVIGLLFDLNREYGTTLVLVTHDEQLASRCQRVLRLAAGRIAP